MIASKREREERKIVERDRETVERKRLLYSRSQIKPNSFTWLPLSTL